jgi:hypothetical protein
MAQDHYLLTEEEVDRLRGLSEGFHYALFEFINSRRIRIPPWEDGPETQNYESIFEEVEGLSQTSFDF